MWAAMPLLLVLPKTDWSRYKTGLGVRSEFNIGGDFVHANGRRALFYYTLGRWAGIPFVLLGGWVCFKWAGELYGSLSAIIALLLWSFSPDVLGHGHLVTPDVPAASCGVLAGYTFWRWLKDPSWHRAAVAGVTLGVAQLTKSTWIILDLVFLALWALALLSNPRTSLQTRRFLSPTLGLALILSVSVLCINQVYLFDGSCERLGRYGFISDALKGPTSTVVGNRFAGSWLADLVVPLPRDFVLGVDEQKADFEHTRPAYILGAWRKTGHWAYYLFAALVKLPVGTWVLALGALTCTLLSRCTGARDDIVVLAPAVAVFGLASYETGINEHFRYVLPALPFVFVWVSKCAQLSLGPRWLTARCIVVALVYACVSSLWSYPHNLAYFNELTGGPGRGPSFLLGSNVDWGQDLVFLEDWRARHQDVALSGLSFHGGFDASDFGFAMRRVPMGPWPGVPITRRSDVGPRPGWYAISVTDLYGVDGIYKYLKEREPQCRVGYSLYVYHVTVAQANQLRETMGLERLRGPSANARGDG
jgi:hypothetical protein